MLRRAPSPGPRTGPRRLIRGWRLLVFPGIGFLAVSLDLAMRHQIAIGPLWATAILAGLFSLPAAFAVIQQVRTAALAREVETMRAHEDAARREMASIAHDLKGPLNTVSSYLDLIAEGVLGDVSDDAREAARSASEAQARAREMVEVALLHHVEAVAARPAEAGDHEPVDLGALVHQVTEALRAEIAASGAHVTVAPLPVVLGDAATLFRVFENLLQNAVKYARPGEAPRVSVDATTIGERVQVAVHDHGIGIPAEDRERVFEPEARCANGAGVAAGHGLGLATARRLARDLGGDVCVDPAVMEGATLLVSLRAAGNAA